MDLAHVTIFAWGTAVAMVFLKYPTYAIKNAGTQNFIARLLVFAIALGGCLLYDPSLVGMTRVLYFKAALLDSFKVGLMAILTYHALTLSMDDLQGVQVLVGKSDKPTT